MERLLVVYHCGPPGFDFFAPSVPAEVGVSFQWLDSSLSQNGGFKCDGVLEVYTL